MAWELLSGFGSTVSSEFLFSYNLARRNGWSRSPGSNALQRLLMDMEKERQVDKHLDEEKRSEWRRKSSLKLQKVYELKIDFSFSFAKSYTSVVFEVQVLILKFKC